MSGLLFSLSYGRRKPGGWQGIHWSTHVYHAPEFTYGNVRLLLKNQSFMDIIRRAEYIDRYSLKTKSCHMCIV